MIINPINNRPINNRPINNRPNRKPIKDILGDVNSLGIVLMNEDQLHQSRVLSGASEVYKHEYAVWYSSLTLEVHIGKNTLYILRPFGFYNTEQDVSGGAVDIESEAYLELSEIKQEIFQKFQKEIVPLENMTTYKQRLVDYILRLYVNNKYPNGLGEFTGRAKEIVYKEKEDFLSPIQEAITNATTDKGREVAEEELMEAQGFFTEEYIIEEIEDVERYLATVALRDQGFIIEETLEGFTDKEMKDIEDNNKLTYCWIISDLSNFHAHPTGVNSFSGTPAGYTPTSPVLNGTGGDLRNSFEEYWDDTLQEYVPTANAETGIVYPFSSEFLPKEIPIAAGVVQQIQGQTELIFNELRLWQSEREGDYTYKRTPLITYVEGAKKEVEILPVLQMMFGKILPQEKADDYLIEYLNPTVSVETDNIFNIYKETPTETLYAIDAGKVKSKSTFSHYPKTYYKSKKKIIEWFNALGVTMFGNKKLNKLSAKKLKEEVDNILPSLLFKTPTICVENTVLMQKVFALYKESIMDFVLEYKNPTTSGVRKEEMRQIITAFITLEKNSLYQFEKAKGDGLKGLIGLTSAQLTTKAVYVPPYTQAWGGVKSSVPDDRMVDFVRKNSDLKVSHHQKKLVTSNQFQMTAVEMLGIEKANMTKVCDLFKDLGVDPIDFINDISMKEFNAESLINFSYNITEMKYLCDIYTFDSLYDLSNVQLTKLIMLSRIVGEIPEIVVRPTPKTSEKGKYLRNKGGNAHKGYYLYATHLVDEMFEESALKELTAQKAIAPKSLGVKLKNLNIELLYLINHPDKDKIVNKIIEASEEQYNEYKKLSKFAIDTISILLFNEIQLTEGLTQLKKQQGLPFKIDDLDENFNAKEFSFKIEDLVKTINIGGTFQRKESFLSSYGVTSYEVFLRKNSYAIQALNSANIDKAITLLFLILAVPEDILLEEVNTLILNIYKNKIDIVEILKMPQSYVKKRINLLINK